MLAQPRPPRRPARTSAASSATRTQRRGTRGCCSGGSDVVAANGCSAAGRIAAAGRGGGAAAATFAPAGLAQSYSRCPPRAMKGQHSTMRAHAKGCAVTPRAGLAHRCKPPANLQVFWGCPFPCEGRVWTARHPSFASDYACGWLWGVWLGFWWVFRVLEVLEVRRFRRS